VEVTAAFLCDWAEAREGLLMAVAGGITRLWRETYPSSFGTSLAILVAIPQSELEVPHDIDVKLMGPDMQIGEIQGGFQIGRGPDLEVGEMVVAPITLDLRAIQLPAPGSYSLNISIDGEMKQAVSFIAKPPGTRPAGPSPPGP